MTNVEIELEDDLFERVRQIAERRQTTVEALITQYLTQVSNQDERLTPARRKLIDLVDASEGGLAPGWKFNREEIYDR